MRDLSTDVVILVVLGVALTVCFLPRIRRRFGKFDGIPTIVFGGAGAAVVVTSAYSDALFTPFGVFLIVLRLVVWVTDARRERRADP